MKPQEQPQIDRSSDAFEEGARAYIHGITMDECPYLKSQPRMDWFSGWLEKWSEIKHGELFRKYGVDGNAAHSNRQRRQHRRFS